MEVVCASNDTLGQGECILGGAPQPSANRVYQLAWGLSVASELAAIYTYIRVHSDAEHGIPWGTIW